MQMGLRFHGPSPEPPNRLPRMHNVVPGAKAYIATLHARLLTLGGQLLVNAPVVGLQQPSDGEVTGVVANVDGEDIAFKARRGVILAAGDYANSAETIARFKGEQYREIEGINPHAEGDGHRLAEQAGAKLLNMDVTYGPELRFVPPKGSNVSAATSGKRLAGKVDGSCTATDSFLCHECDDSAFAGYVATSGEFPV